MNCTHRQMNIVSTRVERCKRRAQTKTRCRSHYYALVEYAAALAKKNLGITDNAMLAEKYDAVVAERDKIIDNMTRCVLS